jgi:hypothetical protein
VSFREDLGLGQDHFQRRLGAPSFGQLDPGVAAGATSPAGGMEPATYLKLAIAAGLAVWVLTKILDNLGVLSKEKWRSAEVVYPRRRRRVAEGDWPGEE